MNMKWNHVRGNTWCIEGRVCIPVYLLNEGEAVLLDSGYAEDRPQLDALLREKGLRVRAILGSHSHNDHSGNHSYYQSLGAEIILPQTEAALVSDAALLTSAYWPATAREIAREFPHLLIRSDRSFPQEAAGVEIAGRAFGLLPLPGHTPGHTGIITPDDVLYVGDALLSPEVLHRAKLPSTADWETDLASKRRLETVSHSGYLLAHSGIYRDLRPLIDENIADEHRRAQQILKWLRERPCWTQTEAVDLIWQRLGLRNRSFFGQVVFRRNAICALEYLVVVGCLRSWMEEGNRIYQVL